jgi:hypothetical protein
LLGHWADEWPRSQQKYALDQLASGTSGRLQGGRVSSDLHVLRLGLPQDPGAGCHMGAEQSDPRAGPGRVGTYLDLVTSWFDTAYVGRNGAGYINAATRLITDRGGGISVR